MSANVNVDSSHDLFVQSILQLNGSIVLKWDDIAKIQNKYSKEKAIPVSDDKRTWAYYMHIAGEYHPTDVTMTITSIDTLETIVFSKETLAVHKTSAEEYKYGSSYYNELVLRYPKQEDLIKGILNPVPLDTAIAAEELTILTYNKDLVEPAESNLITELQTWLYSYYVGAYNRNYLTADALYLHTELDNIYGLMSAAIYNIRLNNVRTNRAHSFHIWAHLASNGGLDRYREHLTDSQRLYLYRNIERLQEDAGRAETFDTVVQKFLIDRGIPLYTYEMVHMLEPLLTTNKPDVRFKKVSLTPSIATVKNNYSINAYELLAKEEEQARDNTVDMTEKAAVLERRASNTPSSHLYTKVLETEVIDTAASEEITPTTVLLNHWLYWGATGNYNGMVQIENPFSGELMQMSPIDAYNLNFWFWCKANQITLGTELIPKQVAFDCLKPTTAAMVEEALTYKGKGTLIDADVDFIINNQPTIKVVNNLTDFTKQCNLVFKAIQNNRAMTSAQETSPSHMAMCSLTGLFTTDYECDANKKGETFDQMLGRLGHNFDELTPAEAQLLMINTTTASVGNVLGGSNTLVDMQNAMVAIVRQLSSYDLQFISQMTTAPNKNTPFSMPRYYDSTITFTGGGEYDPTNPDDLLGKSDEMLNCDIQSLGSEIKVSIDGSVPTGLDMNQIFNYELLYLADCHYYGEFEAGASVNERASVDVFHNNLSVTKQI